MVWASMTANLGILATPQPWKIDGCTLPCHTCWTKERSAWKTVTSDDFVREVVVIVGLGSISEPSGDILSLFTFICSYLFYPMLHFFCCKKTRFEGLDATISGARYFAWINGGEVLQPAAKAGWLQGCRNLKSGHICLESTTVFPQARSVSLTIVQSAWEVFWVLKYSTHSKVLSPKLTHRIASDICGLVHCGRVPFLPAVASVALILLSYFETGLKSNYHKLSTLKH